jgi:hypothetical protein
MRVSCVYAKADGLSYMDEVTLPMDVAPSADSAVSAWSKLFPVTGFRLFTMPSGGWRDWHINARPGIAVLISGSVESEVGGRGGQRRVTTAGSMSISMDATGQGHRTRVISDSPAVGFTIALTRTQLLAFLDDIADRPADFVLPESW